MRYGLIGERLGHSFSPLLHGELGDRDYALWPLPERDLEGFLRRREFDGANVTIPYKQSVLPYCDEVSETALRIGAVNTIANRNGRLVATNTDYDGVAYTLDAYGIEVKGKTVLLLGNGGTTRTVKCVLADRGAGQVLVASRRPEAGCVDYAAAQEKRDVQVVINCSPVGMYPHNGEKSVDLAVYPVLEAVFDVVYNPLRTALLLQAEELGVTAVNGLAMLVAQAKAAREFFTGTPIPEGEVQRIVKLVRRKLSNISLIGMPGCGKTSLGRMLGKKLGRTFVDLDDRIEKEAGKSIPEIFAGEGEAAFRAMETHAARQAGRENGQVIATGGGIVKRTENLDALRQNGILVYIDCPAERLAMSGGRPLAQSREDLHRLEAERAPLYRAAADIVVSHRPDFNENLRGLERTCRAHFE